MYMKKHHRKSRPTKFWSVHENSLVFSQSEARSFFQGTLLEMYWQCLTTTAGFPGNKELGAPVIFSFFDCKFHADDFKQLNFITITYLI